MNIFGRWWFMPRNKNKPDRDDCRPPSRAVTLHDLQQAKLEILAAIREAPLGELKAAAERLRKADENLKAAVDAQSAPSKKDKT
jgi:hypothetical protein